MKSAPDGFYSENMTMRPRTVHTRRARRAHAQRGLTLIELMVGFTIAILLTLAAIAFAAHETRLMGISRERLDLAQASRAVVDLLAEDIKQAGAGIGYRSDGTFAGLLMDNFVAGGVQFNPDGGTPTGANAAVGTGPGVFANLPLALVGERETAGASYTAITTDIGILTASGSYATIAEYNAAGAGMFCTAPGTAFDNGEFVVLRTQSSFDAFTAVINVTGTAPCNTSNGHDCVGGCTAFNFAPNGVYATDLGATNRSYLGGEIAGGVQTIVWFAVSDGTQGHLRRVVFDSAAGCAARDDTCGGNVVDNVEALVAQAWTFDAITGTWSRAGQLPIATNDRIRVDIEIVMRSRKSSSRPTRPAVLNLLPSPSNCIPSTGACNEAQDHGQRTVLRTSVEVKNSGRMSLGGGVGTGT